MNTGVVLYWLAIGLSAFINILLLTSTYKEDDRIKYPVLVWILALGWIYFPIVNLICSGLFIGWITLKGYRIKSSIFEKL